MSSSYEGADVEYTMSPGRLRARRVPAVGLEAMEIESHKFKTVPTASQTQGWYSKQESFHRFPVRGYPEDPKFYVILHTSGPLWLRTGSTNYLQSDDFWWMNLS
ncbi:hypothetical protein EVAR_7244_1 [Eumeta japonica]|uniref:Uncharacterized protein n=1 Tax=Eumeta variegata TaxID=151549 RepID=A0A4C1T4Z6_EUMVA|nr:hypothetical protein EVAR_7244_1 [Eumeta japonica]